MALTDRNPHQALLPAPTLGPAGYVFTDAIFGQRMVRVTDPNWTVDLSSSTANYSFRSPSSAYQRGWSADNSKFFVVRLDSRPFVVGFNPSTMACTRLGTGVAYLPFNFGLATWDHANPNIIYGMGLHSKGHQIMVVDVSVSFTTGTLLIDLDDITPGLPNPSYIGGMTEGNGYLMAIYGATNQEFHNYIMHYPLANPSAVKVLNVFTREGMDENNSKFAGVHGGQISKNGRYIMITPTQQVAHTNTYNYYVWDTTLDTVYPLGPINDTNGHKACNWQGQVNTPNNGDCAQWTYNPNLSQATIATKSDIISPLLLPRSNNCSDHQSWNNATPAATEPFCTVLFRVGTTAGGDSTLPWRAWENEVIMVAIDGSVVTRCCHTRSDYWHEPALPTADIFWYTPRPNMSNDGKYAYFTTNWNKTLGIQAGVNIARQDVFIVELTTGGVIPPPPLGVRGKRLKTMRFR